MLKRRILLSFMLVLAMVAECAVALVQFNQAPFLGQVSAAEQTLVFVDSPLESSIVDQEGRYH